MKTLDFEEINNHHHIAETSENDDRTRKYLRKMIPETRQLLENIVITLEKAKEDQREIRKTIDTYRKNQDNIEKTTKRLEQLVTKTKEINDRTEKTMEENDEILQNQEQEIEKLTNNLSEAMITDDKVRKPEKEIPNRIAGELMMSERHRQ